MQAINVSRATKAICLAVILLIFHGPVNGAQTQNTQEDESVIGHRYDQTTRQDNDSSDRRRPGQPPQRAIDACSGKGGGEKVEFKTPRGNTISGTCVKHGDLVFAIPEGGPPAQRRGPSQKKIN